MKTMPNLKYVNNLWQGDVAREKSGLERLVYRSNLLGSDCRITNTGGGSTSSKLWERDPLTGQNTEVLWVKGSGGDLRTASRESFSSLYLEKLRQLEKLYEMENTRGAKSEAEDRMVELYGHCAFNLNQRAPSIDTPLHAFIPHKHVDHTHPKAVIAVAASKDGEMITRELYGDEVLWIPWQRPGFDLGVRLKQLCEKHPGARGAVLGQHGLINWADDDEECYYLTLELIDRAARLIEERAQGKPEFGGVRFEALCEERRNQILAQTLPWLRGRMSRGKRMIGTVECSPAMLSFVCGVDAARLARSGTSCPDQFLRTRIMPLYVEWNPQSESEAELRERLAEGLEEYQREYIRYYDEHKRPNSAPMRDPHPTVILIPGIGMVAWERDKSESRVTAEFYNRAVEVMRGAEAISSYTALPAQEAFDIEYWSLEAAKLRRMPSEKELAGRVVAVFGAGSAIGRETSQRLAAEGAHIVAADSRKAEAKNTAEAIINQHGMGIGVAGSGTSSCGPAIGIRSDITDRESVRQALREAVFAYGGIDAVVVTEGLVPVPETGCIVNHEDWNSPFRVSFIGAYNVADEAAGIWKEQGLAASLVLTSSVKVVVAMGGPSVHNASRAVANRLVRELAIELAPLVRVNAVIPATVIDKSGMFPRDTVIALLAEHGLPYDGSDSDEELRRRLAEFYAQRSLMKTVVTCADQAEAVFLLVSERLAKTTGQILSVDGGSRRALLRSR